MPERPIYTAYPKEEIDKIVKENGPLEPGKPVIERPTLPSYTIITPNGQEIEITEILRGEIYEFNGH